MQRLSVAKISAKRQLIPSVLLGMGLVFSVATQLRVLGLPVGLGEMLLSLWLLSTLLAARDRRDLALLRVSSFAVGGALLLAIGYFLSTYPEGRRPPSALHDTLAYLFCAALAINYASLSDRYESRLPTLLLWGFLVSALVALVFGVMLSSWTGMDVMYHDVRWQHLSNNPNQFSLLLLPLPFLALHLILRQSAERIPLMPVLLGSLALGLGWYGRSSALTLAWIGGGLAAVPALRWGTTSLYMRVPGPVERFVTRNNRIASLLILLMVAGSVWQWRAVAKEIFVVAGTETRAGASTGTSTSTGTSAGMCPTILSLYQSSAVTGKGEVSVRLALWCNALTVIHYAPLTGFGPGAHSGFVKPFAGEEAHNTLLDWGTQTGLAGVAVLAGYLGWLLWQVLRRRHYELIAMLLALYVFAMFHFVLRQPLFWIVPLLTLQLALCSGGDGSDA